MAEIGTCFPSKAQRTYEELARTAARKDERRAGAILSVEERAARLARAERLREQADRLEREAAS